MVLSIYATIFPPTFEGGPYLVVGCARPRHAECKLDTPISGTRLADCVNAAVVERDELAASLRAVAQALGHEVAEVVTD